MRQILGLCLLTLIAVVSLSCGAPATAPPTATPAQATATAGQVAKEAAGDGATPDDVLFPLSEPGPYHTGKQMFTYADTSRSGREIRATVFYPALLPEGSKGDKLLAGLNRDLDLSGGPYPLTLTGANSGDELFEAHLASNGFAMAIVRSPGPSVPDFWDFGVVDAPRDILLVLDQLSSNPPEGLDGVIDTDHVGVTGYSWEGLISLAGSGV